MTVVIVIIFIALLVAIPAFFKTNKANREANEKIVNDLLEKERKEYREKQAKAFEEIKKEKEAKINYDAFCAEYGYPFEIPHQKKNVWTHSFFDDKFGKKVISALYSSPPNNWIEIERTNGYVNYVNEEFVNEEFKKLVDSFFENVKDLSPENILLISPEYHYSLHYKNYNRFCQFADDWDISYSNDWHLYLDNYIKSKLTDLGYNYKQYNDLIPFDIGVLDNKKKSVILASKNKIFPLKRKRFEWDKNLDKRIMNLGIQYYANQLLKNDLDWHDHHWKKETKYKLQSQLLKTIQK